MTPKQEQSEREKFRRKWENQDFGWTNSDFNIAEKVWLSRAEEAHKVMEELKKKVAEYRDQVENTAYEESAFSAVLDLISTLEKGKP